MSDPATGGSQPVKGLRARLDESLRVQQHRERRLLVRSLAVMVPTGVVTAYLLASGSPGERLGAIAVGALGVATMVGRLWATTRDD